MKMETQTPVGVAWVLFMLLFVAVNAHAVVCCYHALNAEWLRAKLQEHVCSRKRRRVDQSYDHISLSIAWDADRATNAAIAAVRSHRKRRKLSYRLHALTPRCLCRENMPWPWPMHISFQSSFAYTVGDCAAIGKRVATDWLGHPVVVAGAVKLKGLLHSALEEMLVSCLSFVMCACVVVLLRTYSSLVVGVSVDLGAFSIDM